MKKKMSAFVEMEFSIEELKEKLGITGHVDEILLERDEDTDEIYQVFVYVDRVEVKSEDSSSKLPVPKDGKRRDC